LFVQSLKPFGRCMPCTAQGFDSLILLFPLLLKPFTRR
ncbi:hypothetical protein PSYJA_45251, partial [Pseudomonas syringae pv. japonica str. M301072]